MKLLFSLIIVLAACNGYGQTAAEAGVLQLSANLFTWEVQNNIDSLDNVFDGKFTAYTSNGNRQDKEQYMAGLKGGKVIHNSIMIEESSASVVDNTATVGGKGRFTVTVNGVQKTIHLSYLEVFTRKDERSQWKVLALHAGLLPN